MNIKDFEKYIDSKILSRGREYYNDGSKSSLLGITQEERMSQYGKSYTANLYSKEAQQFIIDHLGEIVTKEI